MNTTQLLRERLQIGAGNSVTLEFSVYDIQGLTRTIIFEAPVITEMLTTDTEVEIVVRDSEGARQFVKFPRASIVAVNGEAI